MSLFSRLFGNELPNASKSNENTKHYVSRKYVISEINNSVYEGCYVCTFRGVISDELKKELEEEGYTVRMYISDRNYQCTEISWK